MTAAILADHHLRQVTSKGYIKWRDSDLYLTEALQGQTVALAQRDDGDWVMRFRQFDLAMLDDKSNAIRIARLGQIVDYFKPLVKNTRTHDIEKCGSGTASQNSFSIDISQNV